MILKSVFEPNRDNFITPWIPAEFKTILEPKNHLVYAFLK